jgi:hypothetical protein
MLKLVEPDLVYIKLAEDEHNCGKLRWPVLLKRKCETKDVREV